MERRFMVGCTDKEVRRRVEKLVGEAMGSRMTAMYDQFQWKTGPTLRGALVGAVERLGGPNPERTGVIG